MGEPTAELTQQIASSAGRSVTDVADVIAHTSQAEVDRAGRVLGVGLTLIPTPHRVLLPGRAHQLYVWCVPDAFAASRMLHRNGQIGCITAGRRHLVLSGPSSGSADNNSKSARPPRGCWCWRCRSWSRSYSQSP